MRERLKTVSRTIVSVNQLSIYGAVSDLCDEYRTCQARTTPSTKVPAQEDSLQKYKERVERLSQQNRVIKICTDSGFLSTVEVGQYLMTKDTEEFSQFTEPVACREYTLPRDEKSSDPTVWIRGNTKIGPVLEVTTSYLQGKYGVELKN